jgi:hypothetical protein
MQPLKDAEGGSGVNAGEEVSFTIGVSQCHRKENSAFVLVLVLDPKKLSFGTSLPASPGNGIVVDNAMHQRGGNPLALRRLENVQPILAVSDQPSFVEGNPLAHICPAVPVQPLQIGRGILSQFERLEIGSSRAVPRGVLMFEEISDSGVYQLIRARVFPASNAVQHHVFDFRL